MSEFTTTHWATPIYHSNLNDENLLNSLLDLAGEILIDKPSLEEFQLPLYSTI